MVSPNRNDGGWGFQGLLLLLQLLLAAAADKEFLYRVMEDGASIPVIDYVPPKTNSTKNNFGGSELEQPNFLYSKTGPGAVARVVEFYA